MGRLGTGLGNTSAEPSYPLQWRPCVASQACQRARRAEQVRHCIAQRLRLKLVACLSVFPPLSFPQYISSSSAPQCLLSFCCPCPNTVSSHVFPIRCLTTAPLQAMHQGTMSGLMQIQLFQESLLIQELRLLPCKH